MRSIENTPCFIIAGGGTGGHLFPGIAVAEEIRVRIPGAVTVFIISHRPMEAEILARHAQATRSIDIEGLQGRGWRRKFSSAAMVPRSILQCRAILTECQPAAVIGMGGYSAGPACLAARWMGIPTAIHEQNSFPGLTNRWLSRVVDRVFISFEESRPYLKGDRIVLTGNPVRKEILAVRGKGPAAGSPFTLLVVGGSQGAKAINEVMIPTVASLAQNGRPFRIIHQTGKDDFESIQRGYRSHGVPAEVFPFIDDMAGAYAEAHLVIGRAGATTVFELAAAGKPSVLVPYPYAANNHQESNALSLVHAGGALMIRQSELTAGKLAGVISDLAAHPERLDEMRRNVALLSRPDAAAAIVDGVLQCAEKRGSLRS